MQLSHTFAAMGAEFDDASVIGSAGLVPLVALAQSAGLPGLVVEHLGVPTDKGANADLKVMSLVAGMAAGADSIAWLGGPAPWGDGPGVRLLRRAEHAG
jgi:hypothetical protein